MRDDRRRARQVALVAGHDAAAGAGSHARTVTRLQMEFDE